MNKCVCCEHHGEVNTVETGDLCKKCSPVKPDEKPDEDKDKE